MNNPWWVLSRASGLTGYVALGAVMLTGTRVVRRRRIEVRDRLDWHRAISAATMALVILHVAALLVDGFADYGLAEIALPLVSVWRPGPVGWGVGALYLVIVIQASSVLQGSIRHRRWRRIHDHSYVAFAIVTIHALSAGSDFARWIPQPVLVVVGAGVVLACGVKFLRAAAVSERDA